MEREWLERELTAGRSIEAIAREVGRDPSTVAYWVNKHGLTSQHAPKHAARGGLAFDVLAADIAEGLSARAIAAGRGVSYATVRHWLRSTASRPSARRRRRQVLESIARWPRGDGDDVPFTVDTRFVPRGGGGYRCARCRSEQVSAAPACSVEGDPRREAGGACELCGYDRSAAALQFHHLDPAREELRGVAGRGLSRESLDAALREEARKCVLLCANCHAEVESGARYSWRAPADNPG